MSVTWPEYGIGLILNEKESSELIKTINEKENEQLTDLWDITDTTLIPSNVIITENIIWEHIVDINGKTIPNEKYEKLISDTPGIIICSKKKMLPLPAAYNNIDEIIDEMKYIHSLKIIHRDIKLDDFDYTNHLIIYDLVLLLRL